MGQSGDSDGYRLARLEGRMDTLAGRMNRIEDKLDWLHDCVVPAAAAFVVGAGLAWAVARG